MAPPGQVNRTNPMPGALCSWGRTSSKRMKLESSPRPPTDNAVFGPLRGGAQEPTYGGVLSFMRRRYSRDLTGVDVVELAPAYDHADISAIAAATIVQRHIGALARRPPAP